MGGSLHRTRRGEPLDLMNIDVRRTFSTSIHLRLEELGGRRRPRDDGDSARSATPMRSSSPRPFRSPSSLIVGSFLLAWMATTT